MTYTYSTAYCPYAACFLLSLSSLGVHRSVTVHAWTHIKQWEQATWTSFFFHLLHNTNIINFPAGQAIFPKQMRHIVWFTNTIAGNQPRLFIHCRKIVGGEKTNVYIELCYGAITKNKPHKTPPFVQFNRLLSMQLHCKNSWVVDFGGLFVAASLEQSRAVCRALICP